MQDMRDAALVAENDESLSSQQPAARADDEVVSTHVLVPDVQAEKLRHLARKTRIAQSEYLREAVNDLLEKYGKGQSDDEG
ncbi:MAG TPA: ribbon-helix-helix domain-containing protein [Myxococcaceae bacterium]|nr:ribbon-helix-helix domain-containing protein [Myxococcaceae bacterium]